MKRREFLASAAAVAAAGFVRPVSARAVRQAKQAVLDIRDSVSAVSANVENFAPFYTTPRLWNVWKSNR